MKYKSKSFINFCSKMHYSEEYLVNCAVESNFTINL